MSDDRALILIDCQLGFNNPSWGKRNNPDFEANAQAVLAHWRARGGRIIHVRHASLEQNSPLRAEEPGFAFFEWAEPLEDEVEIVANIEDAGFVPRRRNMQYEILGEGLAEARVGRGRAVAVGRTAFTGHATAVE